MQRYIRTILVKQVKNLWDFILDFRDPIYIYIYTYSVVTDSDTVNIIYFCIFKNRTFILIYKSCHSKEIKETIYKTKNIVYNRY